MATLPRPSDLEHLRGVRDAALRPRDELWILVGVREPGELDDLTTTYDAEIVLGTLADASVSDVVTQVESWFEEWGATTESRHPIAGYSATWRVTWPDRPAE
jgi:hypothetical protein